MEDDTRKYLEVVLYTYVMRIICFIGIFGNITILIVLARRRGSKETAFVYIRALAVLDLTICVFLLGMGFVRCGDCYHSSPVQRYLGRVFEGFIYLPVANFAQMSNLFITMCMAVHRVLCILQMRSAHDGYLSLRVNVRRSRKLAKQLVTLIVISCAIVNSIRFFFYHIEEVVSPDTTTDHAVQLAHYNHTLTNIEAISEPLSTPPLPLPNSTTEKTISVSSITFVQPASTRAHADGIPGRTLNLTHQPVKNLSRSHAHHVHIHYKLTATPFFEDVKESFLIALSAIHFGELLVLTTVNIILIRILRLSKLQRKHLIRAEVRQRKRRDGDDVTQLLILLVIASLVCHVLSPISTEPIATRLFGLAYTRSNAYTIQLAVNNTLTLTSHAITFFLYLVSRKFRRQVHRTCHCIINRSKSHSSLRTHTPNTSWTPNHLSPILCRKKSSSPDPQYL